MGCKGKRKKMRTRAAAEAARREAEGADSIRDDDDDVSETPMPKGRYEVAALLDAEAMEKYCTPRGGGSDGSKKKAKNKQKNVESLRKRLREEEIVPQREEHLSPFSAPLAGLVTDVSFLDATLRLRSEDVAHMIARTYPTATRIQRMTIPLVQQGYHVISHAPTGSGKTLAYLIPILDEVSSTKRMSGKSLVLAPTKELVMQILQVANSVTGVVHATAVTGGTSMRTEGLSIPTADIVVGTPGRLAHHVAEHDSIGWNLTQIRFVVLDEADRLLDPSFQLPMDAILLRVSPTVNKKVQFMLFSATNTRVLETVKRVLPDLTRCLFISTMSTTAVRVSDGTPVGEEELTAASTNVPRQLHQTYVVVPRAERLCALYAFLKQRVQEEQKVMVFCSTCASSIFHCMFMGAVGFHDEVLMLHGDMKHRQRLSTYDLFVKSTCKVLFTTDVAARGLDVPDVSWVLQFDAPSDPVAYVHRIGRTARASRAGRTMIFLDPNELRFVEYLRSQTMSIQEETSLQWDIGLQEAFDAVMGEDDIVARAGTKAYVAFLHGYQSHILGDVFNVDDINLEDVACSFALQDAPVVTLKKKDKEQIYTKGKVKSMMTKLQKETRKMRQAKRGDVWSLR